MDPDADIIVVFGGTNDSWAEAPLGEIKYSDWAENELYFVLPAICYFLNLVRETLPQANIYCIINTEIKPEIISCFEKACEKYQVCPVAFDSIDKDLAHPTIKGMQTIKEGVLSTPHGDRPLRFRPARFSSTYCPTTSSMGLRATTSSMKDSGNAIACISFVLIRALFRALLLCDAHDAAGAKAVGAKVDEIPGIIQTGDTACGLNENTLAYVSIHKLNVVKSCACCREAC